MSNTLLTTIDNPYHPAKEYDKWLDYDHTQGYYTQEYAARLADVSVDDDEDTVNLAYEQAYNEIIDENVLGIYRLIKENEEINSKTKTA